MSPEAQRLLQLLEQRITLLGSLAEALLAARSDVVSFDLDGLEARISDQERLCIEIRSLDAHIDHVQRQCATQIAAAGQSSLHPLRDAATRLRQVQSRVKQLNDAHQRLLRRSRRTVSALLNSYHSFAMMTYGDPASMRSSAPLPATLGERA